MHGRGRVERKGDGHVLLARLCCVNGQGGWMVGEMGGSAFFFFFFLLLSSQSVHVSSRLDG